MFADQKADIACKLDSTLETHRKALIQATKAHVELEERHHIFKGRVDAQEKRIDVDVRDFKATVKEQMEKQAFGIIIMVMVLEIILQVNLIPLLMTTHGNMLLL